MPDDIVFSLRRMATADFREAPRIYVSPTQAADEIERLRAERKQWFIIANEMFHSSSDANKLEEAVVHYLRTRGNLEDPR